MPHAKIRSISVRRSLATFSIKDRIAVLSLFSNGTAAYRPPSLRYH